jgi:restriction system protein
MRPRHVLKFVLWCAAVAAVLSVAFDPDRRAVLCCVAGAAAGAFLLRLVVRRARLGRAALLQLDAMSGAEFEDYVAERVRAAGWRPSAILRRGDFGADLVAEKDGVRIAVQAKRRAANVGNRAVQEASAGADFHGCAAALVVTQARFTDAARRQARASRRPTVLVDRSGLACLSETLAALAAKVRLHGDEIPGSEDGCSG